MEGVEKQSSSLSMRRQPDIAKIHQLGILNAPEVRGICEDSIEAVWSEVSLRGIGAIKDDGSGLRTIPAGVSNPFVWNRNSYLAVAVVPDFKRLFAERFGLCVFFDDVCPAPAADTQTVAGSNTEQVRFTLDQTDRKAVYEKNIKRLERHRFHDSVARAMRRIPRRVRHADLRLEERKGRREKTLMQVVPRHSFGPCELGRDPKTESYCRRSKHRSTSNRQPVVPGRK